MDGGGRKVYLYARIGNLWGDDVLEPVEVRAHGGLDGVRDLRHVAGVLYFVDHELCCAQNFNMSFGIS
jgi:hypothetical protein